MHDTKNCSYAYPWRAKSDMIYDFRWQKISRHLSRLLSEGERERERGREREERVRAIVDERGERERRVGWEKDRDKERGRYIILHLSPHREREEGPTAEQQRSNRGPTAQYYIVVQG